MFAKQKEQALDAIAQAVESTPQPNIPQARKGGGVKAKALRLGAFGLYGAAVLSAMPVKAWAASPGTGAELNITSISSILAFVGNIIVVVGVVVAGWALVQIGMTAKESGGLQFDKNVWGVIGGVAMAIAGRAIKSAGDLWEYGDV